jgi:hypothetical protein
MTKTTAGIIILDCPLARSAAGGASDLHQSAHAGPPLHHSLRTFDQPT